MSIMLLMIMLLIDIYIDLQKEESEKFSYKDATWSLSNTGLLPLAARNGFSTEIQAAYKADKEEKARRRAEYEKTGELR